MVLDSDLMSYKTFHNHRVEPYFTFVKNGQKTVEGRIKKGQYTEMAVGDRIVVHNMDESDSVEVKVVGVRYYSSVREMLTEETLKKLLPDVDLVEDGIKVYRNFYTEEQEKKFGVVAIEIERIIK